jgi:hypothetical protein
LINPGHFQDLVIDPSIEAVGLFSPAASELLLGTALQESRLTHLTQLDGDADPYDDAMGVYQTERKTIIDIWENYLAYRPELASIVLIACGFIAPPDPREVVTNLKYAAIIARLVYLRVPEPLPMVGDTEAQASYWKRHYNTAGGHGSVEQYFRNWQRST